MASKAIKPLSVVPWMHAHPREKQQGFGCPAPYLHLEFELAMNERFRM
jgi:hypothetical protein